jgi:hypothetical protein
VSRNPELCIILTQTRQTLYAKGFGLTAPTLKPSKLDGEILLVQLGICEMKSLLHHLGTGDNPNILLDRIGFVMKRAMGQVEEMIETDQDFVTQLRKNHHNKEK